MDPIRFFRDERWTLGVIGLGYVGLPMATNAAHRGLGVIGYDLSGDRVDALKRGESYVEDVDDAALQRALDLGARFSADSSELADADMLVLAVPSPLKRNREPDMSYIEAAAETVASVARAGQLIALESTTYPGTTEEILLPAVEATGLTLDENVWVAFSPERVDPGNPLATHAIPKVVGGVSPRSSAVATAAYERLIDRVHTVSTARAAELTKLLENTYRAVNIALINELAQMADVLDVDIWEVVDAAETKPFGFQAFRPGPGVGGHCIPLDPQFLAYRARELRAATRFIDLAEDVNQHMPAWVASRVADVLNQRQLPVSGTPILGVGLAYKPNVGDDRESPARDVLEELSRRGARIGVIDPHVSEDRLTVGGFRAVAGDDALEEWEAAVILTDHEALDYDRIATEVPIVFDCRGVYRRLGLEHANVVSL